MIDATHPLLTIAVDCLALKMEERPNARELCRRIEVLVDFPSKATGTDSFNDVASWEEAKRHYEEEIQSLRQRLEVSCVQNSTAADTCPKCKATTSNGAATILQMPSGYGMAVKNWRTGSPAPKDVAKSSSTVFHNSMICSFDHLIYDYNVPGNRWRALPEFSVSSAYKLSVAFHAELGRLYAFKDRVMFSMYDGKWMGQFESSFLPWAVLPCGEYFLLVGPEGDGSILQLPNGHKVSLRSSLSLTPHFEYASARICNGAVYLICPSTTQTWTKQVFKYPLADVMPKNTLSKAWFEFSIFKKRCALREIASLPVTRSTCVSFNDRLLAVGGFGNNQPSGDIFLYDEEQDKWKVIGRIPTPRYNCLAEVVGSQLVVIGGWLNHYSKCNVVEIATLNM